MLKLIRYPAAMLAVLLIMSFAEAPVTGAYGKPQPFISFTKEWAKTEVPASAETGKADYFSSWKLSKSGMSRDAFDYAMLGYQKMVEKKQVKRKGLVVIIDFSKPSTKKRLYIVDVKKGKLLLSSLVAHGRNSGSLYATDFSNETDSHQSSLGFYITQGTYTGNCGYSLRLKGCEKGINDKAYDRDIVMHGSDYVSEEFVASRGTLGRSYGCPAVPMKDHKKIIDMIKGGTLLFLYHPTKKYISESKILNQ